VRKPFALPTSSITQGKRCRWKSMGTNLFADIELARLRFPPGPETASGKTNQTNEHKQMN
jgi:hypothetical protein